MRETSQWKFEQIPIKNKEVRIFLSCDQSNTNWQLYDVKCELNFHLLSTKKI